MQKLPPPIKLTAQKKYRFMAGQLDQEGILIHVNRVDKKWYELTVNFEKVKRYKQRRSCNRYIEKLYTKTCES
jgi:hypothetical protein